MARLSQEEVQALLNKSDKHPEVDQAVAEENRARFHTESALSSYSTNPARQNFLNWVAQLIDASKQKVFEHLMTDPIATIDVTESIFNEVKKVFEGQDRFVGYQFTNPNLKNDFELYLKAIKDESFWKTEALQAVKNGYNSFVIVDLPVIPPDDQTNPDTKSIVIAKYPKPYYYILPIKHVLQVEINPVQKCAEYIFFLDCENSNLGYIFDDAAFRTCSRDDKGKWSVISEVPHNLGYTPAKQIWQQPLSHHSKIRKRGLITNSLGNLDKLLFKIVSQLHVELYAEYPVMSMFSQKCDYQDPEGNACEGGRIRRFMKADLQGNQNVENFITCPKCQGGVKSLGAGSIFEAPAMANANDPNLLEAVKFITVDPDIIDGIATRNQDLKNNITYSIIGILDTIADVAINKDQVKSQYESRQNVLMDVKNQMEDIHKWTHETVAILRYDKAFQSATVNYGTQFFLKTPAELTEIYKSSKDNGMPSFELANQRIQIYETKYRSNPEMLQRVRIMLNIEPYQDYSIAQIKDLMQIGDIFDERLLALKLNFDNYIQRFEREFTDVNSFMQHSKFDQKIDMIRETLLSYVDEAQAEKEANAPEPPVPSPPPNPEPNPGPNPAPQPEPAPAPAPEPQPSPVPAK